MSDLRVPSVPAPSLEEMEDEIRGRLEMLERIKCAKCRAQPANAVPEPCDQCQFGQMLAYIEELRQPFHLDFVMNRWVGQCGHRFARLESERPEKCPVCELLAKGRPRGLVKRVAELTFYA